jgi:hypothetical protein
MYILKTRKHGKMLQKVQVTRKIFYMHTKLVLSKPHVSLFLSEIDKLILKVIWKCREPREAKHIWGW